MSPILLVGCGWLGQALATRLQKEHREVIATYRSDSNAEQLQQLQIKHLYMEVGDTIVCPESNIIADCELAVVMLPPRARKGGASDFPKHIRALLDFLQQLSVRDVILISSTSVYPSLNQEVDERCQVPPESHSGQIMLATEQVLREQSGMRSVIVRLAGLMGPKREPGRFLAGRTGLTGADVPVNMIVQDDAVQLLKLIIDKQPWGEIYNGCAPIHPSKKIFYTTMAARQNQVAPSFDESQTGQYKIVKSDKAQDELGMQYQWPDPMSWHS